MLLCIYIYITNMNMSLSFLPDSSVTLERLRSIRQNVVGLLTSILPNLDMQGISYDTNDVDSILQQIIQANNLWFSTELQSNDCLITQALGIEKLFIWSQTEGRGLKDRIMTNRSQQNWCTEKAALKGLFFHKHKLYCKLTFHTQTHKLFSQPTCL